MRRGPMRRPEPPPAEQRSRPRPTKSALQASWEIDFFGRLKSLSDAALQQYFASAYARQAAEILLVSQVADQYLTLLAFDEQLQVTRQTTEIARASYDIVKLQFDTGTGTELALRQAQTVVELAQANYAAQVRGRAQAENALVLLVGQPLPADLPPLARLGDEPILADIPEGLPSDLLTRRPDILQAEAFLRSDNANIGAARAAFFPTISLTGNLGTASASLSGLFGGGSTFWSLIPSLTVPIFNAGALKASLDVAEIQKHIGIAQYEKAIQTAFREVADGLAARGTYDDQVAATERYTAAQQRRARALRLPLSKRRGQLSHGAHRADRLLRRAAHAGDHADAAPDQPRRPVSGPGWRMAREDGRCATPGRRPMSGMTGAPMTPEERIDAALEDSFPASDAPWWTLGVPGKSQPEAQVQCRDRQSSTQRVCPGHHLPPDVRSFPAGRLATGRFFLVCFGRNLATARRNTDDKAAAPNRDSNAN